MKSEKNVFDEGGQVNSGKTLAALLNIVLELLQNREMKIIYVLLCYNEK